MAPGAREALDRLLAASGPGERVSIDAIADAVGAAAVSQLDIEEMFDALEAAGHEVWAPEQGEAMPLLRRVLGAARSLRVHGVPSVEALAAESGCSVGEVRRALLLGRVLGKGSPVRSGKPS